MDSELIRQLHAEANDGVVKSQLILGNMYFNGSGVVENKRRAFYHYHQAACEGNENAIFFVIQCYQNGWGITRDEDMALMWLDKIENAEEITRNDDFKNMALRDIKTDDKKADPAEDKKPRRLIIWQVHYQLMLLLVLKLQVKEEFQMLILPRWLRVCV